MVSAKQSMQSLRELDSVRAVQIEMTEAAAESLREVELKKSQLDAQAAKLSHCERTIEASEAALLLREQALKEQEGALGAKVDALMKEKDRALQSKHQILIQSTRDILKVLSASQLSLERERFQAQLEDSEAKWWRGISAHEDQYVCVQVKSYRSS